MIILLNQMKGLLLSNYYQPKTIYLTQLNNPTEKFYIISIQFYFYQKTKMLAHYIEVSKYHILFFANYNKDNTNTNSICYNSFNTINKCQKEYEYNLS